MALTTQDRPVSDPASADAELLFKEAKRRERRRRFAVGAIVLVIAGGAVYGFDALVGGPPSNNPDPAASFGAAVASATSAAGSARVVFTDQIPGKPDPCAASGIGTSGTGVVNFEQSTMAYATAEPRCSPTGNVVLPLQVRMVGGRVYETTPDPVDLGVTAAKPWLLVDRSEQVSVNLLRNALTSPRLLSVVEAMDGSLTRLGPSVIDGSLAMEYEAQMPLRSLYSVGRGGEWPIVPKLEPTRPQFRPPLSHIVIPVRLWVDGSDRLIRLQAALPLFTAGYSDHRTFQGLPQAGPTDLLGGSLRSLTPYGIYRINLTLSQFGIPTVVAAPSRTEVEGPITGHP